jgi:hypothetical protein
MSRQRAVSSTIWLELDIAVSGTFVAGCPAWGGSRTEPPINPPEPDDIEDMAVDSVTYEVDGKPVDLLAGLDALARDTITETILNTIAEQARDALIEEAAEW